MKTEQITYSGPAGACLLRLARAASFAASIAMLPLQLASAASQDAWPVVGRQGLVRFVIVPTDQASDATAYQTEIGRLCEPERTCFLNFYTNSTAAPAALPLPEAIAAEATATFRRSMKNGVEILMWSCRMKVPSQQCF